MKGYQKEMVSRKSAYLLQKVRRELEAGGLLLLMLILGLLILMLKLSL